jgi:hypothetical protein
MEASAIKQRLTEIREEIEWMHDNYSGCDWCCGGGDETMALLLAEELDLETKLQEGK